MSIYSKPTFLYCPGPGTFSSCEFLLIAEGPKAIDKYDIILLQDLGREQKYYFYIKTNGVILWVWCKILLHFKTQNTSLVKSIDSVLLQDTLSFFLGLGAHFLCLFGILFRSIAFFYLLHHTFSSVEFHVPSCSRVCTRKLWCRLNYKGGFSSVWGEVYSKSVFWTSAY